MDLNSKKMANWLKIVCLVGISLNTFSQVDFNAKGSVFLHGGYIRTGYNEGAIAISSDQYDIEVSRVRFSDSDQKTGAKDFFNFSTVTNIQYTIQGGYFFRDYFAVTLGVSNHLIFMDKNQGVHLTGTLEKNAHPTYNGTEYDNFVINPNVEQLYYAQRNGVRFLKAGLLTSHQIPLDTQDDQFSLMVNGGVELGPLFSSESTYFFGGNEFTGKAGLSGFGMAAHGSFRAIFLNHVYIQAGINGGYFSHSNIQLNRNGEQTAKHRYPFLSPELSAGITVKF